MVSLSCCRMATGRERGEVHQWRCGCRVGFHRRCGCRVGFHRRRPSCYSCDVAVLLDDEEVNRQVGLQTQGAPSLVCDYFLAVVSEFDKGDVRQAKPLRLVQATFNTPLLGVGLLANLHIQGNSTSAGISTYDGAERYLLKSPASPCSHDRCRGAHNWSCVMPCFYIGERVNYV